MSNRGREPRRDEVVAGEIVSRTRGAQLGFRPAQEHATWDCDGSLPDGKPIVLEVKQIVDESVREVEQNLRRRGFAFTVTERVG
jgi:hypothetical protein